MLDGDDAAPIDVNDLGCGHAGLFEHLERRGTAVGAYVGYDISEEMLRGRSPAGAGRRRPVDPLGTVDTAADYSFASDIFNVRLDADEEQ